MKVYVLLFIDLRILCIMLISHKNNSVDLYGFFI